jgi:hypothetical protein
MTVSESGLVLTAAEVLVLGAVEVRKRGIACAEDSLGARTESLAVKPSWLAKEPLAAYQGSIQESLPYLFVGSRGNRAPKC